MLEDMQLRGLFARTQEPYTRLVSQLAQHFHRSPDQLGDEELRQSLLLVHLRRHHCIRAITEHCALSSLSVRTTATNRSFATPIAAPKTATSKGPAMILKYSLLKSSL
jgi:hypothetical protein